MSKGRPLWYCIGKWQLSDLARCKFNYLILQPIASAHNFFLLALALVQLQFGKLLCVVRFEVIVTSSLTLPNFPSLGHLLHALQSSNFASLTGISAFKAQHSFVLFVFFCQDPGKKGTKPVHSHARGALNLTTWTLVIAFFKSRLILEVNTIHKNPSCAMILGEKHEYISLGIISKRLFSLNE